MSDASERSDGADRATLRRAAHGGLCGGCRHARLVTSARGSAFLRCDHPLPPRYPPMPVLRCSAYAPLAPE